MASKKGGLGATGLDRMFGSRAKASAPAVEEKKEGDTVTELAVKDLVPNPYQPRHTFDPEKMQDLIYSVKESGVIQPLIVRKKGRQYEIVAGERRWRAAKEAGLAKVPVVVRTYDDAAMMEVALVENLQRSDLDPLEEARGIKRMMEALQLTQEEAAKRLGKSRAAVANTLRLLNLPEAAAQLVAEGQLTAGQVRPLLGLEDPEKITELAQQAAAEGWSARAVEEVVNREKQADQKVDYLQQLNDLLGDEAPEKGKNKSKKALKKAQNVYVRGFQDQLTEYLGTRVKIEPAKKENGGRIIIEYYNDDDLERVYDLLKEKDEKPSSSGTPGKFTV